MRLLLLLGRENRVTSPALGFALLESLIALLVFSVGFFALIRLALLAEQESARNERLMHVSFLVDSRLEQMKALPAHSGETVIDLGSAHVHLQWASRLHAREGHALSVVAQWLERDGHEEQVSRSGFVALWPPETLALVGQRRIQTPPRFMGPALGVAPLEQTPWQDTGGAAGPDVRDTPPFDDSADADADALAAERAKKGAAAGFSGLEGPWDEAMVALNALKAAWAAGEEVRHRPHDPALSRIEGKVVMEGGVGHYDGIELISSGEGLCVKYPLVRRHEEGGYAVFDYVCYLPPGWYGVITLSQTGPAQGRVCVGDPQAPSTQAQDSRHPAALSGRQYQGPVLRGTNGLMASGLGITLNVEGMLVYRPTVLQGHDFFMTPLSSSVVATECRTRMNRHGLAALFVGNPGAVHCLGGVCP